MKISELVKILEYDFVGADYEIDGIAYSDEASEYDIAIIKNKREIELTKSNVILTQPILTPVSKTMIITYDDIGLAIKKISEVLIRGGKLQDFTLPIKFRRTEDDYYIGCECVIDNAAIIYPNVYIGNYVKIGKDCLIEPNVVIGSGTIIEDNVHIGSGSKIGADSFYHYYDEFERLNQFSGIGRTILHSNTNIGSNCIIQKGTVSNTIIGNNCMIGNCIDIGHDVKIGNNCKIVSQTGIAGNVQIKNNVMVFGQVGIANDIVVGNNVVIKAKTVVSKSIEDNKTVFGLYGRDYNEELRIASRIRKEYGRKEV